MMLFKNHLILVNIIKMISSESEWPGQGEYIDFKDKDNNPWQVGYIVSKAKNIIKVRSEGWSSKFDQFIQISNTTRIKPFRTLVRGYTGQVKNPALRQHWKFSIQTQKQNAKLLTDFLNSKESKTQHQIAQFLRGSHYFWIDFLLTITYSNPEQLTLSYDYLKEHIKFAKQYLDQAVEVGIYEWCTQTNLSQNVKAYRQSYYEVMDALYLLTGINVRQIQFQKNNEKVIKLATNQNLPHDKYITKFMGQVKLDETYLKIVNKLQKETFVENKIIPIPFLYQFFHTFAPIQRALLQKTDPPYDSILNNKQQRKKLTLRIFHIIKKQIEYITPLQLKFHQNQKEIDLLLQEIRTVYFKYGLQQLTFQWIEKVKLKIAFLLIQSDTLERKLKGITKIKDIYQSLMAMNEFNTFRLKNQDFASFLKDNRIIESLYENNEHPQILKKGSQICQLFLKSNLTQINSIVSIWKACSHKHQAIRKVIYQLWVDIIPVIDRKNLQRFTEPLINSCSKVNEDEVSLFTDQWQIQLLFTFINNFIKQFQEVTEERQQIDAITAKFIDIMYDKLLLIQTSSQIKQFVGSLAKLINSTLLCNKIIKQAYQSIAKNIHTKLNLQLLMSFYQQSLEKETYLPSNALQIIFMTFQSKNSNFSSTIFQLMDQVINFSINIAGNYILTQQKFESLWNISQKNEEIKTQFYSWLIKKNNDGLFGVPIYQINQSIPSALKSVIFKNFLCDYNKLDYFNLTLEQLQIFKEFLIHQNEQQNRIQLKRLMTLVKIVRVKNQQIIGTKFMWDIFLNCKNEDVIRELSKIIIVFHFNYHQSVNFATKKSRIANLMVRLQKHLKDGFKKGNLKLMRHSLILLKDIVDLVKEKHEPKEIMNNYQQFFKTIVKVLFQNKKYEIEIFFGVTYYEIKTKIAELIKLQRTKFGMFSLKNQEISLQFAQVPFCFMQEKTIKVLRILQNEQTTSKIVLDFTKDRLENILIDMLQDETICENVYNVLQDIEIKVEQGQELLDKLTNIIEKHCQQKKEATSKYQIYIYLFYLRILHFMIDRPKFLDKFIKNKQFNKLVEKLQANINNPLMVVYLFSSTDITFNILKKIKIKEENTQIEQIINDLKETLKERCMNTMNNISHYINTSASEEKEKDYMKKVRIIFNCLNIIEQIQKTEKAIYFLANHSLFSSIITKIYLHKNISEVRLIFSQKLKKIIQKSREVAKNNIDNQAQSKQYMQVINKIARIFIVDLYPQIIKNDGVYSSQKKVIPFYKLIAFIINFITTAQFQTTVAGTNESPQFYHHLLEKLKELTDHQDVTSGPNFILSSHLFMLHSIYLRDPSLLTEDILDYLLYQCLFHKQGKSISRDASCKRSQTIKSALDVVQAGCLDYSNTKKLIKIIAGIQQFHQIEYWRTADNWSTSIEEQVKAKYVGLENPGCICYHNSLLQQLYMTKTFKNAVAALDLKSQEGDRFQMLKALKELFFNLQYSEQIALNPLFFTKTIKTHDNKPLVKIFMQMDIDQFCSILFDKIENHLTLLPNQPNIVKNIFGGKYAHEIISKECNHSSEREQQFISIGLQVKKSILQSFNTLIKGQMLDGENKYYCQKCDKKVKAQKMLTIKRLPQNLILSIKRFQYNYQIDAKIKINDYCEFPMELNLKKYSQQQINKANTPQNSNVPQQGNDQQSKQLPDDYFKYKLKGVVVHTGSADSGHYYSFIEDSQKNWFQFNDSHVSPFDIKNLAEQAFGSKDSFEQKVKNAYLLFYQRVETYTESDQPIQLLQNSQNEQMIHQIISKNKTINKFRLLFSKDYGNFVNHLFDNIHKFDLTLDQQQKWHNFILSYYLLIKVREGSAQQIIPMSNKILKLIQTNKYFSNLFFSSIIHINFLEQIFVYGSNREKIKIISNLLTKSFINYYEELPNNYNSLKETLVQKLFNHIKSLTIIHGNIYQLELFIEAVLNHTRKNNDYRIFTLITQEHSLEKYMLINLFGLAIPKQEKELAVQYREQIRKESDSILGRVKHQGKKSIPSLTKLSWQIVQYLLEYAEPGEIVEEEDVQQPGWIVNVNGLLQKIIKSGALTRIIHQCAISKSVYRLYKVFKLTNKVYYLVDAIQKGLKDFQSTKYRPLLLLFYMIVVDQDTPQKLIKIVIEMLTKVHTINEKYFLQVNFIHQWMLKCLNDSPLFLKNLAQSTEFLDQIINWISLKSLPSLEIIKKHKNPANERLLNRLDGILVSSDPKDYQSKSKQLKLKFQSIRDHKFELVNHHEKWQAQYLDDFTIQQSAFYYDMANKQWNKLKIIDNSFGLLKLQQADKQEKNHFLVWTDNERLCSFKKYTVEQEQSSESSEEIIEAALDPVEEQDLYT